MRWMTSSLLLALTACGQSAEQRRAADEADIEAVKAAQNRLPPLQPMKPDPLMQEDIARIDASGPGCMVRLGEGLAPPVLVTVGSFGWVKLDGAIIKVAGDSGSEHGPVDTWTRFTGKQVTLRLEYPSGPVPQAGQESQSHPVTLTMRDPYDRVIYRGQGTQTCST